MGYRASLSTGTRAGGQSASAKHKYQNRQEVYLIGRDGVRDDLVASGSGNLPAFADGDAGKFWLAVDSYERKNARLFVELQLNLPRELSLEQQKESVKNYMSALCDAENLPYSWVIHQPKNGENPHAHVMISETKNDSISRPAEQHFKRFNSKYPERGGAQKSASLKPKQWLLDARGSWAIAANDALEKAGFPRHFDHRTLKEQRVSALLARDWRKAASLDREVGEHEGWRVAALRRKFEAGDLPELPEYAKKVIESNDRIKALNAAHLEMIAGMSDVELERWEREAYFAALAEREPARLDAEIEQLHSEALRFDALHDAHSEAQEDINEHNPRSAATFAERRTPDSRGVREHEQYLFIVQERRNNQILRDTQARSESREIQRRAGDVHYQPMAVQPEAQSIDRDARDGLHHVRAQRVEQPEPQPQPQPEPPAPQAAQDADFLEDEDMTTQENFKQKQQAALASMRAEKAAQLVQSEPAAELEAEAVPKLRLVQPDERAAEPVPEVAAEQQASRLAQLRAELEAQDAELEALAEQAQDADRFAAEQAQKAGELEQQYRESMQQQKRLEAQADALEPTGFQALVAFVARALGFRTQSDRLREQARQLAAQRFEQQRTPLLEARAQAESAKAEAAEARQDLQEGKTQRAELADAVMLERGPAALKKAVAREVQKVEKLQEDFEKLGSSKAFELQQQREAITQVAEPSDEELLQQAKDLNRLVKSGARDYRGVLLEASKQAQKDAEAAYRQARETLRSASSTLGSEYKKELDQQLSADRAHFFKLMSDPKSRTQPELFRELASDTRELDQMVQQHMQEAQQLEQIKQLERQQRESAPRQRQERRSDFGL